MILETVVIQAERNHAGSVTAVTRSSLEGPRDTRCTGIRLERKYCILRMIYILIPAAVVIILVIIYGHFQVLLYTGIHIGIEHTEISCC